MTYWVVKHGRRATIHEFPTKRSAEKYYKSRKGAVSMYQHFKTKKDRRVKKKGY